MTESSFDWDETITEVRQVIESEQPLVDSVRELIEYCEDQQPGKGWSKTLALDFEQDMSSLQAWLENVLSNEPPDDSIDAFWFGLFESVFPPDDRHSLTMYLAGSDCYDPDDDTGDWASGPAYFPEDRYADSSVLDSVFRIAGESEDDYDASMLAQCALGLGYAALAVRGLCRALPKELLLGDREERAVAIGFDEGGDFITLPPIAKD